MQYWTWINEIVKTFIDNLITFCFRFNPNKYFYTHRIAILIQREKKNEKPKWFTTKLYTIPWCHHSIFDANQEDHPLLPSIKYQKREKLEKLLNSQQLFHKI